MKPSLNDLSAFDVPLTHHVAAGFVHGLRRLWCRLGNIESTVCREKIEQIENRNPIFIAGLARAGSTILLEAIASHEQVVTHRYRDFWTIYAPYWWEQALQNVPRRNEAVERSHGDGIMVTPDSPEAMEEILWTAFFKNLHDPAECNVLDSQAKNARFERFYRDHIRKLLLARNRQRYASKGNYNVSRLEYLLTLFPDAKFVVPVRNPRTHIASLKKQHELLMAAAKAYPRSRSYLRRVGHFEFGADRVPINVGHSETIESIQSLWNSGEEVRGLSRYWAYIHGWLADRLESNARLRESTLLVKHEDLCGSPETRLRELMDHCELDDPESVVREFSGRLHTPTYYQPSFTAEEERAIVEETEGTAARFGYVAEASASNVEPASVFAVC